MVQRSSRGALQPDNVVRPMSLSDVPVLKNVIRATGLFPPDLLDGMVAPHLTGATAEELWVVAGQELPFAVGYAAPERMTLGTWNLLLIAVHPDRQGLGIGAAVVQYVESALTQRGARLLLVETSGLPPFKSVRGFYRHIGFEEEGRIRGFYNSDEDKVIFRKVIAAR